ncbi:hypothetical protein PIB30_045489 [Stylosanthes scabra]|uniref:Uncharacterized protein n=1 Tax=Stylosanthes scabra TaxID=79078 RepID=A0ABU6XF83_9FABA|nr:hypothetical protein [Stylosanthes scabra]
MHMRGLPRLCVVRKSKGATPKRDQRCLGVDGSFLSTHMRPLPRICVELFLRFASKLRFLLCKLPFFIFPENSRSEEIPSQTNLDGLPKGSNGKLEQTMGVQQKEMTEIKKQLKEWTRHASSRDAYYCWAHQQANPNLTEIPIHQIPDLI